MLGSSGAWRPDTDKGRGNRSANSESHASKNALHQILVEFVQ
jgi:hypothetical protein